MKIQVKPIINEKNGSTSLGHTFWLMGSIDKPKISTIYEDGRNATDFTQEDFTSLKERFGGRYEFYAAS